MYVYRESKESAHTWTASFFPPPLLILENLVQSWVSPE
jgi:hypothetical protein